MSLKSVISKFLAPPGDLNTEEKSRDGRDQAVIISYPKTGTTWFTIVMGRYIQLLTNMDKMPLLEQNDPLFSSKELQNLPYIFTTHQPLEWSIQTAQDINQANVIEPFANKKVVLLTRYPLDTIISHYMHVHYKLDPPGYVDSLESFTNNPVFGLDKFFKFYDLWAAHQNEVEEFAVLKYEDMKIKPEKELERILSFLSIPIKQELISSAVEFGSFDNMKKMESEGAQITLRTTGLYIFGGGDRSNNDAFHVRKGKVGGYRDYFNDSLCNFLENMISQRMHPLYGYAEPVK